MDRNGQYFDHVSGGNLPDPQKPVKGSGGGLFLAGLISGLAGALLILAVVYLGVNFQDMMENRGSKPASLQEGSAIDETLISKLQALEDLIHENFYLGEVTNEELQTGIYRGMLAALGDIYSEYYSAEDLEMFMQQAEGIYYGIGAYVGLDAATGFPKISGVIQGAPAETADLRANDLIYEVDGESTYGLSLTEAVSMIKGPEGTDVVLTIVREGVTEFLDVTITRAKVEAPTVNQEMLEEGMAYIQVTEFDDVTVDQFAEALAVSRGSGMKGLILDLRANPGGNLDAVVDMCRMILPKGMIVYTENKKGQRNEYTCDGDRELEVPLVVLVDMKDRKSVV